MDIKEIKATVESIGEQWFFYEESMWMIETIEKQKELLKGNFSTLTIGVNEAAEIWGLSPSYIKDLCAKGKVDAIKIGKTWIINRNQENPKKEKEETECN